MESENVTTRPAAELPALNISAMDQMQASMEFQLMVKLATYLPPIFFVLGFAGNITVLVLLVRSKSYRKSSASVYLLYLIFNYTLELQMDPGILWLSRMIGIRYVPHQADWLCRLWMFMSSLTKYTAGWFVALLGVDRATSMWSRRKAEDVCTPFTAKAMVAAVVIGNTALCIHNMWTYSLNPIYGCEIDPEQRDFETLVWPWVLALVCSYTPLLMSFFLFFILAIGISHSNHRSPPRNGSPSNELCVFALCLNLLHFLLTLPGITVNMIGYFNPPFLSTIAGHSRMYLAQELTIHAAHSLQMAVTPIICLMTVPHLRAHAPCPTQRAISMEVGSVDSCDLLVPGQNSQQEQPAIELSQCQTLIHLTNETESTSL